MTYKNLWDAAYSSVQREIYSSKYISPINNPTFHLKKLKKRVKLNPKQAEGRKKYRAEINEKRIEKQ